MPIDIESAATRFEKAVERSPSHAETVQMEAAPAVPAGIPYSSTGSDPGTVYKLAFERHFDDVLRLISRLDSIAQARGGRIQLKWEKLGDKGVLQGAIYSQRPDRAIRRMRVTFKDVTFGVKSINEVFAESQDGGSLQDLILIPLIAYFAG